MNILSQLTAYTVTMFTWLTYTLSHISLYHIPLFPFSQLYSYWPALCSIVSNLVCNKYINRVSYSFPIFAALRIHTKIITNPYTSIFPLPLPLPTHYPHTNLRIYIYIYIYTYIHTYIYIYISIYHYRWPSYNVSFCLTNYLSVVSLHSILVV